MAGQRFTVNAHRCTWDTVDGETMVIDTVSGALFVLRGLGSTVWEALAQGAGDGARLAEEAASRYGTDAAEALSATIGTLVGAGLLTADDGGADVTVAWPGSAEPAGVTRFDDIADILTLDPIHDVDHDAGWPYDQADDHE